MSILIKSDLVTICVDFEIELEVAAFSCTRLWLKEFLIITFCQELIISRRSKVLVIAELRLRRIAIILSWGSLCKTTLIVTLRDLEESSQLRLLLHSQLLQHIFNIMMLAVFESMWCIKSSLCGHCSWFLDNLWRFFTNLYVLWQFFALLWFLVDYIEVGVITDVLGLSRCSFTLFLLLITCIWDFLCLKQRTITCSIVKFVSDKACRLGTSLHRLLKHAFHIN